MGYGKTSHSRVYPAAVAVECVGYIDDRLLSTDALLDKNLFGKEKIFLGGSGFAFRENALGIQSFLNQIIPHSLAFRHPFIPALSAGGDDQGIWMGNGVFIGFVEPVTQQ